MTVAINHFRVLGQLGVLNGPQKKAKQIFSISCWHTFDIRASVLDVHLLLVAHLAPIDVWKITHKLPELPPRPLCSIHTYPPGPILLHLGSILGPLGPSVSHLGAIWDPLVRP